MNRTKCFVVCAVTLATGVGACTPRDSKTDYTVQLCIEPDSWGQVKASMHKFGRRSGLEFHGRIEKLSQQDPDLHDQMNYALIDGLHQFGGDDFDLWLVSDPSNQRQVFLNVLSKHDLTQNQRDLAAKLQRELKQYLCVGAKPLK